MNTVDKRKKDTSRARKRRSRDVVYTQAKAFNRKRFLLQLATVAAVVLALLFGMSIFFKVDQVQISGTVMYDPMLIKEASGISEGDNLLLLNKDRITANIRENKDCAYIDEIQIGKKLPGTVVISVTELDVFYAAQDQNGGWWLLSSAGKVIDSCAAADAEDHTRIVGVQLSDPVAGAAAVAYEPGRNGEETVPVTVYASDQLSLAISIIQQMEQNGFIGTVAKIDVTDIGDIQLWYGTRFQMLLGEGTDLPRKLAALDQVLDRMEDHASGILDASFTTWPDEVGHTDFS